MSVIPNIIGGKKNSKKKGSACTYLSKKKCKFPCKKIKKSDSKKSYCRTKFSKYADYQNMKSKKIIRGKNKVGKNSLKNKVKIKKDISNKKADLENPEPESNKKTVQQAEPEANAETEPEANTETEPEANAETEPEANAETEPEANVETEPKANTETEQNDNVEENKKNNFFMDKISDIGKSLGLSTNKKGGKKKQKNKK